MEIKEIKRRVLPILEPYGVRRAALFGGAARGQMRLNSDIDLLVDIKKDIGLFGFVGLKMELEKILGKKVDLVEYKTIKPLLKEKILKEKIELI